MTPSAQSESGAASTRVAQLLRASPDDYWRGIVAKVDAAREQVRHARLLNHEAAHLLAWADIARDEAIARHDPPKESR